MWPLLAFAAMIVIVLVWLEARLGPPPAYRRLRVWARLLPCGCTELWVVRYLPDTVDPSGRKGGAR